MSKLSIGIVDYGVGNIGSLTFFLDNFNVKLILSDSKKQLSNADILILPGVGSFGFAMRNLVEKNLVNFIHQFSTHKKVIGICLGAQLLFDKSYEQGIYKGLGLIPGEIKELLDGTNTGWGEISGRLLDETYFKDRHFYFNHSYKIVCHKKFILATLLNSSEVIPTIVRKNNIFGIQFHPEKSQDNGIKLMKKILSL